MRGENLTRIERSEIRVTFISKKYEYFPNPNLYSCHVAYFSKAAILKISEPVSSSMRGVLRRGWGVLGRVCGVCVGGCVEACAGRGACGGVWGVCGVCNTIPLFLTAKQSPLSGSFLWQTNYF